MKNATENKYIFAVYANLAESYLLNSLKGMAKKLRIDLLDKEPDSWKLETIENFLGKVFDKSKPANDLEQTVEGFFPWIKPILIKVGFEEANRQNEELNDAYKAILTAFCKQLNEIRYYYTHYCHKPIEYDTLSVGNEDNIPIHCCTNYIYDAAVNVIKERFGADEREIEHLRRYKNVEKKGVLKTIKDGFFYTLNDEKEKVFTEKGTAFFISLFLNRKYAYLFLKQLNGFKQGNTRQYRFTLEVFTALSTKPPVQRLRHQEDDNVNYAMDILNELSKIPEKLYDTLKPDYKKSYNDAFIDPDDEEAVGLPERSRIRYRSRFEPLALRYLDGHDDFKEIGFYTYLGNYFHKGYPKTTIDSVRDNRFITFRLAGFCKNIEADSLADEVYRALGIEKIKPETNTRPDLLPDINSFKPHYVEAVNPHYIVNGNNIGIKILTDEKNIFPVIAENRAKLPSPDYWLSKYELPAMLFYAYLRKHPKYKFVCKLSVREILEKYTLRQTAESSSEEKSELMKRRIEKAIYWCDAKLNEIGRINEKDVAFGKKQHQTLKAGKIADTLARDMLWLQPSLDGGRDKITGANFQALQRSIAYYGEYKDSLNDIFTRAGLINSKNPHPFLKDVGTHTRLIDFYKCYLLKRKAYFAEQKKKLCKGKINIQCYPLRDLQRESLQEKLTNVPVFLPRGLFNEAIIECLKKSALKKSTCFSSQREEKPALNVAYLIQQYFSEVCNDTAPDFYIQPRNYRLLDGKKQEGKKNLPKKYLTLEERIAELERLKPNKIPILEANKLLEKDDRLYRKSYNEVCDNESLIRLYQTQDMLLFLIAQELLPEDLKKGDKCKLENIKGLLNTPATFSVSVKDFTVMAKDVKIKDYGKVFAIRYDSRIQSLSDALNVLKPGRKQISYESYKLEDEKYESCRLSIVPLCHSFEKLMVKKFSDLEKEAKGEYYNFTKLVEAYKMKTNKINEYDAIFVCKTRNMFLHDTYNTECISKNDIKDNELNYAEKIEKKFTEKITEMIQFLEK